MMARVLKHVPPGLKVPSHYPMSVCDIALIPTHGHVSRHHLDLDGRGESSRLSPALSSDGAPRGSTIVPQNLGGTIVETFSRLGPKTRYPRICGALAYGHLVRQTPPRGPLLPGTLYSLPLGISEFAWPHAVCGQLRLTGLDLVGNGAVRLHQLTESHEGIALVLQGLQNLG